MILKRSVESLIKLVPGSFIDLKIANQDRN